MSKDKSRKQTRKAKGVAEVLDSCAKACEGIVVDAEPLGDGKKARREARRATDISIGIVIGYRAALTGAAFIARQMADGADTEGVEASAVMTLMAVIHDVVPELVEGGDGR